MASNVSKSSYCCGFQVQPSTATFIKVSIVVLLIIGLATACIFSTGHAIALIDMGARTVVWGVMSFFAAGFGLSAVCAPFVAAHDKLFAPHKSETWSIVTYVAKMILFPFFLIGYAGWSCLKACGLRDCWKD